MAAQKDVLKLGGKEFTARFILGSGKYSMELIEAAVEHAGAQMVTLAVRRTNTKQKENILDYIPKGVTLLPYIGCKGCKGSSPHCAHVA